MDDICPRVAGDSGSPGKCREALPRRRIRMRRLMAPFGFVPPPHSGSPNHRAKRQDMADDGGADKSSRRGRQTLSSPSSSSLSASGSRGGAPAVASPSGGASSAEPPPAFGFVSLSGRSRKMEDAVSLRPGFFSRRAGGGSPLHFFAVFDGHGGSHVSALCKDRMHTILAEELQRASPKHGGGYDEITVEGMSAAMARCFRRMDDLALTACACYSVGQPSCTCEQAGLASEIVGSTAVVAVVDRRRVLVANCGDSRAVLSRGGRAVPLSSDHKPDRPDELARIEEAGGRVFYVNGARVLGILAMSRALGDRYLKPVVISDPEISITERTPEDEFLIVASDGLWDVLSNELACDVTRRCLQDGNLQVADADSRGGDTAGDRVSEAQASQSYCSVAAALLTRLALGRQSTDNISVIVVDLAGGR